MCTDTPQRYLRRILVSDFKQTKRWPIIPSLRRCQCSPPPAYLSMCTDTPQRYLRRILILDFKQKNAGRPFLFQNRFSLCGNPVIQAIQISKKTGNTCDFTFEISKYPWCTPIKCDGIQILTSQLPHSRHNKPTRAQQQKRSLMKSADYLLRNTDNLPYEAARAFLTTNTGVFNIP